MTREVYVGAGAGVATTVAGEPCAALLPFPTRCANPNHPTLMTIKMASRSAAREKDARRLEASGFGGDNGVLMEEVPFRLFVRDNVRLIDGIWCSASRESAIACSETSAFTAWAMTCHCSSSRWQVAHPAMCCCTLSRSSAASVPAANHGSRSY